jgi:hypothetical protein
LKVFEIDPAGYSSASARPWDSIKLLVKKVYIDSTIAGLGITNCNYWFNAFSNCTEVRGFLIAVRTPPIALYYIEQFLKMAPTAFGALTPGQTSRVGHPPRGLRHSCHQFLHEMTELCEVARSRSPPWAVTVPSPASRPAATRSRFSR